MQPTPPLWSASRRSSRSGPPPPRASARPVRALRLQPEPERWQPRQLPAEAPSISVGAQKAPPPKTKQSKLLAAQQKKDQTNNKARLDKKEKSSARSLNKDKDESGNESRSSTMGRTSKSSGLARGIGGVEKNTPKTASKSSLHSKSDSRSSLKAPQLLQSPSGTGLPKPIAAIKGTSKLPQLGASPALPAPVTEPPPSMQPQMLKRENSNISENISQPGMGEPPVTHIQGGGTTATPAALLCQQSGRLSK